jgi:hypothetical protein
VESDIKILRQKFKAPIPRAKRLDGTHRYYWYSEQGWSFIHSPILQEDLLVLKQVSSALADFPPLPIFEGLDTIIHRLDHLMEMEGMATDKTVYFEKGYGLTGLQWIHQCYQAALERLTLEITYHPFDFKNPTTFTFSPYWLKEFRNRWFLFGWNHGENKIYNLALDRITQLQKSKEDYNYVGKKDPEAYFEHAIGVSVPYEGRPEEVRIWVSNELAPYWDSKPLHHTQERLRAEDGGVIYKYTLILNIELKAELLRYGAEVKVQAPIALVDDIKDTVHSMCGMYEDSTENA